jgi:FkbM family methyltransferase
MSAVFHNLRSVAGFARRQLFPTPELAAFRQVRAQAAHSPRHTRGVIQLLNYQLHYLDLLSVCPQWFDIFVQREYEFQPMTRTPRILDCGANIGLATLYFKRQLPGARVTAYEADPELCKVLSENLRVNHAEDVNVVNAALWTSDGQVVFRCDGADSGKIEALPAAAIDGTLQTVPSIRLRDVLTAEGVVDLLKLDIEGAEDAVLADCEPVLDRVNAIILDLHEFDPGTRQAPRILDRLTRLGFTYAAAELVSQPWRPPVAAAGTPFPGRALVWTMTVRAWKTTS